MGEYRRPHDLGTELGGGETGREGKEGPGKGESELSVTEREDEPHGGEHEGCRHARIGFT